MKKNDTAFFVPGPLHLFWTTGLYYLWELSNRFRVILIIDQSYKEHPTFIKAINLLKEVDTIYISPPGNKFKQHKLYINEMKNLLNKHRPTLIIQNNDVYMQNIYLFYICKLLKIECCRMVYQNGRMEINHENDYKARYSAAVINLRERLPFLISLRLAYIILNFKRYINEILNYYIFPLLLLEKKFPPVYNMRTGLIKYYSEDLKKINQERFDYYLSYYNTEKELSAKLQGYDDNLILIKHPVKTVGEECHQALYALQRKDIISIFPTWGATDYLVVEKKLSQDQVIKDVSEEWISAINILSNKFPGYHIVWKIHPASERDSILLNITSNIQRECQNVEILPSSENAQEWIIKSSVIVTDVSTIFWWANMLPDKNVISLDVFGYPCGDEAKYYDGVLYFDNLQSLDDFNFSEAKADEETSKQKTQSFSEFINYVL